MYRLAMIFSQHSGAFKEGSFNAHPTLLEPMYHVEI